MNKIPKLKIKKNQIFIKNQKGAHINRKKQLKKFLRKLVVAFLIH